MPYIIDTITGHGATVFTGTDGAVIVATDATVTVFTSSDPDHAEVVAVHTIA